MTLKDLAGLATKLWPMIKQGNCIAWVGSGLSKVAKYPGWPETVIGLCEACGVEALASKETGDSAALMDKAEECKEANCEVYHAKLAELFGRPVITTRRAYHLLMKLPFKAFVTTNFDPLLSDAAGTHGNRNISAYPSLAVPLIEKRPHSVFHIHGLARRNNEPRGDDLVLAASEFASAYDNDGVVSSFLNQLFLCYDVLFVGCSLSEPDVYAVFQRVHKIHVRIRRSHPQMTLPQRCVLRPMLYRKSLEGEGDPLARGVMLDIDAQRAEDERFHEMNINVIRYEPADECHGEVEQILEYLCAFAETPVSPELTVSLGQEVPA